MPMGPGKYDDALTVARAMCGEECSGILIVINGNHGNGFACQATVGVHCALPTMLRKLADQIDATLAEGKL